jgi:hypothetical protein
MTLDTRWEDVDVLLQRSERTKDEKLDKAVAEIAAQRFAFPTQEHASYRSYVNLPEIQMAVQVGGDEIVPHIVVTEKINTGDTRLVMTAVVCGREQVHEGEAKALWARCASIKDTAFYLFVPVGYGKKAKDICHKLGISYEGVRTWRTTPRGFEVNDVSEPPNPLGALMPNPVRKMFAAP